ncbi:MAG: hypothetical protein RIG62_27350 [Cyclobacteriaceae bacterium]
MIAFVFSLLFFVTVMSGMASVPSMAAHYKQVSHEKYDDEYKKRIGTVEPKDGQ